MQTLLSLDCIPNPYSRDYRTGCRLCNDLAGGASGYAYYYHTDIDKTRNGKTFNEKARENVKQQNEAIAEQVEVLREKRRKEPVFH